MREQATNATASSPSGCWLSALERRLLFSSTFPVRSLAFSTSARRRGRACSICVYFTGRVKSPQSGRGHLAHGEPAVGSVENRSFVHRAPYGVTSAWVILRVDGSRCRPSRGWGVFLGVTGVPRLARRGLNDAGTTRLRMRCSPLSRSLWGSPCPRRASGNAGTASRPPTARRPCHDSLLHFSCTSDINIYFTKRKSRWSSRTLL